MSSGLPTSGSSDARPVRSVPSAGSATLAALMLLAAGAVAVRFAIDAILSGIRAHNPITLLGAGVSLAAATLFAWYAPARRAAQTHHGSFFEHDSLGSPLPGSRWEKSGGFSGDSPSAPYAPEMAGLERLADTVRNANPEEHYALAMDLVRSAMRSANACVFFRDAASGDFFCSNWLPNERRSRAPLDPIRLRKDAFTVRRLSRLATPLAIDAGDFAAWEHGLENLPEQLERRREEIETLQIARARLLAPIVVREECVALLILGAREANAEYLSADRDLAAALAAQLFFLLPSSQPARRSAQP
jgi:GAF domain-containing protein